MWYIPLKMLTKIFPVKKGITILAGSPQHNKGNRNVQSVVRLPATADSIAQLEMLSAIIFTRKVIASICVEQSLGK